MIGTGVGDAFADRQIAGPRGFGRLVLNRLKRAHQTLATDFTDMGMLAQTGHVLLKDGGHAAHILDQRAAVVIAVQDQIDGFEGNRTADRMARGGEPVREFLDRLTGGL